MLEENILVLKEFSLFKKKGIPAIIELLIADHCITSALLVTLETTTWANILIHPFQTNSKSRLLQLFKLER